jgi:hypothetical protein
MRPLSRDRRRLRSDDAESAAHLIVMLNMAGCHQQLMLGLMEEASPEMVAADADRTMATFMRLYGVTRSGDGGGFSR